MSLAVVVGASAADLAFKAPPPPPPVWTGCNVNAGVGYGMWNQAHYSENAQTLTPYSETSNAGGEGWLARFGGGCDYQVGSRWVIGVFADYDATNIHGVFQNTWSAFGGDENEFGVERRRSDRLPNGPIGARVFGRGLYSGS